MRMNGIDLKPIVIGLFGEDVPRTVKNFKTIADDSIKTLIDTHGYRMSYNDTPIHRIMPRFIIQGGDYVFGDGMGGESIYGLEFDDEVFFHNFDRAGLVAAANLGPNTNASQFYITLKDTQWLNGENVIFGQVLEGWETIHEIERVAGSQEGTPKVPVDIVKSTLLPKF